MTATPTLAVGTLRGEQLDQAVEVAIRAFADDAFFAYLFTNEARRARSIGILHRVVLKHVATIGTTRTALVDGRVAGVAVWLPPGRWPFPVGVQLRQIFASFPAFRGSMDGLNRARPLLRDIAKGHPKSPPHFYLQLLMVDPPFQRQGIGGLLQRPELAECDKQGVPAWLETQTFDNLAYYGRFGFRVVHEHKANDEVSVWSLRREPQVG